MMPDTASGEPDPSVPGSASDASSARDRHAVLASDAEPDALQDFDPIVIYAPLRQDGPALAELLRRDGLNVTLCQTPDAFATALDTPVGMFVFTQEAFTREVLDLLHPWLEGQEPWSEPPVLALLDARQHGRSRSAHLNRMLPNATVLVLERPVRALEFLSCTRISLSTRRRQLQLRDQLLLQEDLLRELSHRVKNALANVFAIYRLTFRHVNDLETFGTVFEARLQALSRVHQQLTSTAWKGADLRVIAEEALRPYADVATADGAVGDVSRRGGRVRISGPAVPLPPRQALSAALTLHELAVNAARHGALGAAAGRVDLDWSMDAADPAMLSLSWRERGGPQVSRPSGEGFGVTFIRSAFASEEAGKVSLDYREDGLRCAVRFRIAQEA